MHLFAYSTAAGRRATATLCLLVFAPSAGCVGARLPEPRSVPGAAPQANVEPERELTGALRERALRAAVLLRERGARVLAQPWLGFVSSDQQAGFTVEVERERCLGFLGVTWPAMPDVDLAVHNAVGSRIAEDVRRDDAWPWTRVCVRAGERLRIQLSTPQGAGEVAVLTALDPPLVAPAFASLLDTRPSAAMTGPRASPPPPPPDRTEVSAEELLHRAEARLLRVGLRLVEGASGAGRVDATQVSGPPLSFVAGRCYHVLAVGAAGIDELSMRLVSPDNEVVGEDTDTGRIANVSYCSNAGGSYAPVLRADTGAGSWALALLETPSETPAPSAALPGVLRGLAAEAIAEGRTRGMSVVRGPLRAVVSSSAPLRMPLGMLPGRCYSVTALSAMGLQGVELVLSDQAGRILAADTRVQQHARVYACSRAAQLGAIEVRPGASHGQWVLVAMESEGAS